MPSALETLVKILKLEREQGYSNKAVMGGLTAFSANWKPQAQSQARKAEHFMLVDELSDLLRTYDDTTSRDMRAEMIRYMMDRITGRAPTPDQYAQRQYNLPTEAAPAPSPPANAPPADPDSPRVKRRDQTRTRAETRAARSEQAEVVPTQPPERTEPRTAPAPMPPERPTRRVRSAPAGMTRAKRGENDWGLSPALFADRRDEKSIFNMESELAVEVIPRTAEVTPTLMVRPPRSARPELAPDEAEDILQGLKAPVEKMKSVGPKMAKLLNKLGIYTIEDMLYFRPRRYDDYTKMLPIHRLTEHQSVTVIATVREAAVRAGKNGRKDFTIIVDDGTGRMMVTFFGQHWLSRQLRPGQQIVMRGVTGIFGNKLQMNNPEWEFIDPDNLKSIGIVPIYSLTAELSGRALRRLIKQVVEYWAERIPDPMPEPVLERADLADMGWALAQLHNPDGWEHLHHAKRRLIFDQLLTMQLVMLENRRTWQSVRGTPISVSDDEMETFISTVFPYPLTGAQRRAISAIRGDLNSDLPMNRLLQGDVGSGKTAVAVSAIGVALMNSTQAALMAPTGILAEQHYRGVSAALAKMEPILGYKPVVGLLTGSISASEREAIYRGMADGSIDVVIGTHSLIQDGVEFAKLSVAIIDEQHRFGVQQRGALRGKGTNPHLLVMTATPIPRTLALTMYADLDLSVIDEMPPGRTPIRTRVIGKNDRARAYDEVVEPELEQGRQAFIVYPLVDPSDEIDAESAIEGLEKMKQVFYKHKVGILHGKMKPAEKDEIMAAFRDHAFDVMVTTSVAEVGVDIPNATVMLIEDANRFGLAQLHQFRGRVGRGAYPSYCFLVCETPVEDARERLLAMERYTDGFKLAEIDWKLRGAGDLIGTRQSGSGIESLLADMTPDLIELAQREARAIHAEDPLLELPDHAMLAQAVHRLRDARSDVS